VHWGNMQEMTLEPITRMPFRRQIIAQWQRHWKLGCAEQCNMRFNFCLRNVCPPSDINLKLLNVYIDGVMKVWDVKK